jgi:hypothetical protein
MGYGYSWINCMNWNIMGGIHLIMPYIYITQILINGIYIDILMTIDIKPDYSNGIRTQQSNHEGNQHIERTSMMSEIWRFPEMEVPLNHPSH